MMEIEIYSNETDRIIKLKILRSLRMHGYVDKKGGKQKVFVCYVDSYDMCDNILTQYARQNNDDKLTFVYIPSNILSMERSKLISDSRITALFIL